MLTQRLRRNRKSEAIRSLIQETRLHPSDFILPMFIKEGKSEAIESMPDVYRHNLDSALHEIERISKAGIKAVALFPVVEESQKDESGSESVNPDSLIHNSIKKIKERFPDICLIADVALDPYTLHGHDGLIDNNGEILNDETVKELVQMALAQARAGVDMVAPSDMMDGRVSAIRKALDDHGFTNVSIHAYAAKYASSLYSPFRDALSSRLRFGDKLSYQLNPANSREALLEAALDEREGADVIMVKPAGYYLDIISKLKERSTLPISAYQVSGEYAMIKAAGQLGWIDEQKVLLESLMAIKRAGADMIFTYGALEATLLIDHLK